VRLFVNNVRNDVGVGWYCVLDATFPDVPDFAGVVERTGEHVIAIGRPVDAYDAFQVTFEEHNALSCPEVPNSAKGVHATRC